MSTVAKLVAVFKRLGVDTSSWPTDVEIHRTRSGRHQRSAGAWSWFLFSPTVPGLMDFGSQWSVREILATERSQPAALSLYVNFHHHQHAIWLAADRDRRPTHLG